MDIVTVWGFFAHFDFICRTAFSNAKESVPDLASNIKWI